MNARRLALALLCEEPIRALHAATAVGEAPPELTGGGTTVKLAALAGRKPGQPNPDVIGTDAAQRYLLVAQECAIATRALAPGAPPEAPR